MSQDLPSAGPSPASDAQAPERTYQRPELRHLGSVSELTGTLGGPPGSSDGTANPAYSNS
jgi:hypothetical protein